MRRATSTTKRGRRAFNVDEQGQVTVYQYDSQSRLSSVLYPWTEDKVTADQEEAELAGLKFTPAREVPSGITSPAATSLR
ncbi:hypothetical protein MASR2M78_22530 [Treponema sp.]